MSQNFFAVLAGYACYSVDFFLKFYKSGMEKSILYMYSFHRSIFKNFVQSRSRESNSFADSWTWQEILAAAAAETGKSHTAETFLLPVTFFLSPRFLSLGN